MIMPYALTQVRVFRAPSERLWRALTEPAAIVKWNPPDGFVAEVHELDLREGGRYRMASSTWAMASPSASVASIGRSSRTQSSSPPIASTTPTCRAKC